MMNQTIEALRQQIRDSAPGFFDADPRAAGILNRMHESMLRPLAGSLSLAQSGGGFLELSRREPTPELFGRVNLRRVLPDERIGVTPLWSLALPQVWYGGDLYDMSLIFTKAEQQARLSALEPLGANQDTGPREVTLTEGWGPGRALWIKALRRMAFTQVAANYGLSESQPEGETRVDLVSICLDEGRKTGSYARSHEPSDNIYITMVPTGWGSRFEYNGTRELADLRLDGTPLPLKRAAGGLNLCVTRLDRGERVFIDRSFRATSPLMGFEESELAFSVPKQGVVPLSRLPYLGTTVEHLDPVAMDSVATALFGLLPVQE